MRIARIDNGFEGDVDGFGNGCAALQNIGGVANSFTDEG
jgi:hypothetical protein